VLLYFGLDCGLLVFFQIFYKQAVIPRTIVESPAFLDCGSAEKIAVCAHTTRDPNKYEDQMHFCMKQAQNFLSFFKNSRSKLKNQKPIAVDVFLKAFQ
jgi:hypothetical protein